MVIRRSIRLCGEHIEEPGHICAFFNSRDEEYDTIVPYLKDGIVGGEEVLNVLDRSRLDDHRARLASSAVPIEDSRLRIEASEDSYIASGRFDMDRMVAFVGTALLDAERRGRKVRTVGWMDWMDRDIPGVENVLEYEARMNLLTPTFDCTFMCVYDLSKLTGGMVVDIMATHPYVILRGQVRRNSFYVPPETYLKELVSQKQGA